MPRIDSLQETGAVEQTRPQTGPRKVEERRNTLRRTYCQTGGECQRLVPRKWGWRGKTMDESTVKRGGENYKHAD